MKDVGWGILGTGAIAALFTEALRGVPGARVVAVGSRERARAEAFAAAAGAPRAHASYEDLVRDPSVDVVYVATANADHAAHCALAIAAGKAVLCEKPFALDAASGAQVVEAARRAGVFCMEAMWMRFSPALREALALVRGGALGEVRLVDAQLGFPYDPDPAARVFAPDAGALLDLGVYPLALAHALLGRPEGVRSEVVPGPNGADEQVTALLSYAGGRQAVVAASLRAQLGNGATIHGTDGVLRLEAPLYFPERYRYTAVPRHPATRPPRRGALARLRGQPWVKGVLDLRARLRERTVVKRVSGSGYGEEAAEVQRCLAAGLEESPELPLDASLAVLETVDAIRRAARAPRG